MEKERKLVYDFINLPYNQIVSIAIDLNLIMNDEDNDVESTIEQCKRFYNRAKERGILNLLRDAVNLRKLIEIRPEDPEFVKMCLDKSKKLSQQIIPIKLTHINNKTVVNKPEIICFCGSSKFIVEMAILMWVASKQGYICLGLHLMPDCYGKAKGYPGNYHHLAEMEGVADQMDELHKRKIDISNKLFIVNKGGYIGDSTKSEIEYAKKQGKPIIYLEAI